MSFYQEPDTLGGGLKACWDNETDPTGSESRSCYQEQNRMEGTGMKRKPNVLTLSGLCLAHPFSLILLLLYPFGVSCCSFLAVNQATMFTSSLLPPDVPALRGATPGLWNEPTLFCHSPCPRSQQSWFPPETSSSLHLDTENWSGEGEGVESERPKAMEATSFQTTHHSLVKLQVLGQS